MDFDTMQEAMCLGSMTGKTGENNLGMYGTGMKTAALSIGMVLTVISKAEDTDYVSKAVLDISNAVNGGAIELSVDKYSIAEFESKTENLGMFAFPPSQPSSTPVSTSTRLCVT